MALAYRRSSSGARSLSTLLRSASVSDSCLSASSVSPSSSAFSCVREGGEGNGSDLRAGSARSGDSNVGGTTELRGYYETNLESEEHHIREIEEQERRNGYTREVATGRFAESRYVPAQSRVGGSAQQQQQGGPAAGRGRGIGEAAAGRGRGISHAQERQEAAREDESVSSVRAVPFGRGRGTLIPRPGEAGRGRWIPCPSAPLPPARSGGVGRGVSLGGNVDISKLDIASPGGETSQQRVTLGLAGSDQDNNEDLLPSADESKQRGVEKLLSKLGRSRPQVYPVPKPNAPDAPDAPEAPEVKPQLPFRMPFARPPPAPEHQPATAQPKPVFHAQTPLPSAQLGRGRGSPGALLQPGIGVEPEAIHMPPRKDDGMPAAANQDPSMSITIDRIPQTGMQDPSPSRRVDRMPDRARQRARRTPSPPRMQLSVEEARARAIAILEKGIEKNVAAEGERRRIAGMEKFADATEFLTERIKRAPGQSTPSQPQRPRTERQRPSAGSRKSDRPRRPRMGEELITVSESVSELTPEQEAQLFRTQEEDTFKDRLHTLFLTQFEPEFAMEEFGRNPDIDEPPVLSLEEYLQSYKPFFLPEDAELSQEQKWQEAVKTSLANASDLEKLVEAYAGRGRMTARQQIEKLQMIHQKLPPTVSPGVAAFTQRAFITLQNNPHLNMQQKEILMTNIVSGFSSI